MRTRSFAQMLAYPLLFSALCASVGCGQDITPPALEVVSSPLIPNMELGQGFNPSTESPASEQCFVHDPPTEVELYNFSSRSFTAYDRDEMVPKFARLNQMQVDPEHLESMLNELHAMAGSSPRTLVLPIFIQTIEKRVDAAEGGSSYCQLQNFQTPGEGTVREQFTKECGLQYLQSERYGGYVFLAIDASQLTQIQWRRALQITQAGALTDNQDAEKTLGALEKVFGPNALFSIMRTDHIPAPEPNFMQNGKLILTKWPNYATQITQHSKMAADPNSHGSVIRQVFATYSEMLVKTCSGDDKFSLGFACYNNFNTKLMEFQHGEVVKNLLAQFAWLGDPLNVDRIEWPEDVDPKAEQAVYRYYRRLAASCDFGIIINEREKCDKSFFNEPMDACRDCVVSEVCDPERLVGLANERPSYKIKDPTIPASPSTLKTYISSSSNPAGAIGNADELLCLLSGVQGDFAGGGESIRMTVNPNNEWVLDVHGAQRVDGVGHCVERQEFIGENGDHTWLPDHHFKVSATQQINTLTGKWVTAFQGLQGKMRGGGEAVWASQGEVTEVSTLHSQSFQGELLRAYSTSFGLENFADANNRWAKNDLGHVETSMSTHATFVSTTATVGEYEQLLAHSDDAMCYLTKVQGLLGGSSDSARLTVNGEGFWVLSLSGKCQAPGQFLAYGDLPCSTDAGVRDVRAIARCLNYDQSN